ncbi:MAG: hypothetical protein JWR50_2429 [Mucilaginibacter sp.]|nr:hypothetical protein [Mucilaginibacter sp.]
MKTTILFLATICILAGCKKTATPPGGIIGKWELRKSYGGFAYHDSTFLAGNGTIYQFNPDSSYRFYIKNKLTKQGTFHTRTVHQDVSGISDHQILFSDGTGQPFDLQEAGLRLAPRLPMVSLWTIKKCSSLKINVPVNYFIAE